jgi:hypothetical protein
MEKNLTDDIHLAVPTWAIEEFQPPQVFHLLPKPNLSMRVSRGLVS